MTKIQMSQIVRKIQLDKLVPHPDNPNKMSKANFAKLVRNIERSGRYEPLIVRPYQFVARDPSLVARCNESTGSNNKQRTMNNEQHFQIINGHHRWLALKELGYKQADAIVWDVDDDQADMLLATLNRLCGQDVLQKKLALLKRLSEKMQSSELAKLLPQTKKQIQRLTSMLDTRQCQSVRVGASPCFANPLVFFVSDEQQQVVEGALNFTLQNDKPAVKRQAKYLGGFDHCHTNPPKGRQSKAAKRASALSAICQYYLDHKQAQFARTQKCPTTIINTIKENNNKTTATPSPLPAGGQAPALLAGRDKQAGAQIQQFVQTFGKGKKKFQPLTEKEFQRRKQAQTKALLAAKDEGRKTKDEGRERTIDESVLGFKE